MLEVHVRYSQGAKDWPKMAADLTDSTADMIVIGVFCSFRIKHEIVIGFRFQHLEPDTVLRFFGDFNLRGSYLGNGVRRSRYCGNAAWATGLVGPSFGFSVVSILRVSVASL